MLVYTQLCSHPSKDLVVAKMIELGADINQASNTGELPLSRNLSR